MFRIGHNGKHKTGMGKQNKIDTVEIDFTSITKTRIVDSVYMMFPRPWRVLQVLI